MQLKNISKHRPSNLIIDVCEDEARRIIKTGEFVEATKENLIVEKKEEPKPSMSWTEKEIDAWAEIHAPDIDYVPSKHTKRYILDKLKEKGLI